MTERLIDRVEIPTVPNFLRVGEDQIFSVELFSERELRRLAKRWTDALVERARVRKVSTAMAKTEGK